MGWCHGLSPSLYYNVADPFMVIPIGFIVLMLGVCSFARIMVEVQQQMAQEILTKGYSSYEAYYQEHEDGTRTIEYRWRDKNSDKK